MFLIFFICLNSEEPGTFLEQERGSSGEGRGKMSYCPLTLSRVTCKERGDLQARPTPEALYSPSNVEMWFHPSVST